jgi:hypothetical protein
MRHLPIYNRVDGLIECSPIYREHPGTLLSVSELAAARKEYSARAEETSYYHDDSVRRG